MIYTVPQEPMGKYKVAAGSMSLANTPHSSSWKTIGGKQCGMQQVNVSRERI